MKKKIVNVLGLGPSIKEFRNDGNITIGCNDIWKHYPSHIIVCVDKKKAFIPERLATIENSKPVFFYSHLDEWKTHSAFEKIHLHPARGVFEWKNNWLPYSNNSASVACSIAFRYCNATEIRLFGVDFTNHPNFDDEKMSSMLRDFKLLNALLKKSGCEIIPHQQSVLFGKI